MDTRLSRGAAAALFTITFAASAASAGAQGSVRIRERGDSVFVRAFMVAKMDTITALVRALNHETYGSPVWGELSRKLDSIVLSGAGENRFFFQAVPAPPRLQHRIELLAPRGWVGFVAQGPQQRVLDENGDHVTYFAYPSILSVDPESPADRAGIVPGDVLIAFNGTDVVGHEFNLTRLFMPEKKVGVTIRRDGETKDYALEVVRAPEGIANRRVELSRVPGIPMPPLTGGVMHLEVDRGNERGERTERPDGAMRRFPSSGGLVATMPKTLLAGRFSIITPHGVWGADLSPVGADLAKALKLEQGVLVNTVPEESPAYKSGLRVGDVIVSASGRTVTTLNQLQDQILSRLGDRSVSLLIVRNHKPGKLNVTW